MTGEDDGDDGAGDNGEGGLTNSSFIESLVRDDDVFIFLPLVPVKTGAWGVTDGLGDEH